MRHQPHFHFKTNSPTSWGGAVCPLLHFMAPDFILRGRRSGGGGGGGVAPPVFCQPSLSTLVFFASTRPIILRCGRASSGACSSHTALLTHFSSAGGAAMIGGLSLCSGPRWCYSLIPGRVNSGDLFAPTASVILLPYC